MAVVECPNGHQSTTADYCDQCGAKISGADISGAGISGAGISGARVSGAELSGAKISAGGTAGPAAADPSSSPVAAGTECSNCNSPRGPDDKFCEVCGYDFVKGTLPAAPIPVPAAPPAEGPTGPSAAAPWQAVVTADHDYYDRNDVDDIAFPDHCPDRAFALAQEEIVIGRHSQTRGVHPQIDLSGAPEDTGISHSHAVLHRQPDGSYSVVDPGSTNGTLLNDDPTPLPHNVLTPIGDGDRLYLGAWTKIVFHAPAGG